MEEKNLRLFFIYPNMSNCFQENFYRITISWNSFAGHDLCGTDVKLQWEGPKVNVIHFFGHGKTKPIILRNV